MKTKHILLLAPVLFAIGLLLSACAEKADHYTCSMHPSVSSQDPNGKCPICGMGLVPVPKKAGTNAPAMPAH